MTVAVRAPAYDALSTVLPIVQSSSLSAMFPIPPETSGGAEHSASTVSRHVCLLQTSALADRPFPFAALVPFRVEPLSVQGRARSCGLDSVCLAWSRLQTPDSCRHHCPIPVAENLLSVLFFLAEPSCQSWMGFSFVLAYGRLSFFVSLIGLFYSFLLTNYSSFCYYITTSQLPGTCKR